MLKYAEFWTLWKCTPGTAPLFRFLNTSLCTHINCFAGDAPPRNGVCFYGCAAGSVAEVLCFLCVRACGSVRVDINGGSGSDLLAARKRTWGPSRLAAWLFGAMFCSYYTYWTGWTHVMVQPSWQHHKHCCCCCCCCCIVVSSGHSGTPVWEPKVPNAPRMP